MPLTVEPDESTPQIGVLHIDGRETCVWLRIDHDEIEYVGHLWFGSNPRMSRGVVDRAVLPGRTREEVVALAKRLTVDELQQRYERAVRERRRYDPLRRVTQDMLSKVRRLNQVAIALQAGLLDPDDGADQLAETESLLHAIVDRLRGAAGVEDEAVENKEGRRGAAG